MSSNTMARPNQVGGIEWCAVHITSGLVCMLLVPIGVDHQVATFTREVRHAGALLLLVTSPDLILPDLFVSLHFT
jgi:hypothetical protein